MSESENIFYVSTRGMGERLTAGQAILKGISDDGGLFVPEKIPGLKTPLKDLINLDYRQLATEIFKHFLTDFTDDEIINCVNNAYDHKFDCPEIAPLVSKGGYNFLELFHGKTCAFKDMALSILPYFMKTAALKNGMDKKIIILVSTSGDTGKAALEAFANVPGTGIFVMYPHGKVSKIQQLQMETQEGDNTFVLGINGNFDDCQTTMKKILTDHSVKQFLISHNAVFSSANSINFGRLLPQVVYYFYAYGQMVHNGEIKLGESLNFTVPTGNFGNILAGYYAKVMGLPINKLICASNVNKVLTDFFQKGEYDKNRPFKTTISPSMDILISSNLERLLYHLGFNTFEKMNELKQNGKYNVDLSKTGEFFGECALEEETLEAIAEVFEKGYLMDTHTAVACSCYNKYLEQTGDNTKNVIISTASPFKFAGSVLKGLNIGYNDDIEALKILSEKSSCEIPKNILDVLKKPVLHSNISDKGEAIQFLEKFINTY